MGPVEIHIRMDGQEAHVQLTALRSDTREALQLSMPELQQALHREGLQLGHTDIREGRGGEPPSDPERNSRHSLRADEPVERAQRTTVPLRRGLLDLYA